MYKQRVLVVLETAALAPVAHEYSTTEENTKH